MLVVAAAPARAACPGDCNNDRSVTIDEILTIAQLALDGTPFAYCPSADTDDSGTVTIDELLVAVQNALTGCTKPTPTRLATRTPSQTAGSRTPTNTRPLPASRTATATGTRTASETPSLTLTPSATPTATPPFVIAPRLARPDGSEFRVNTTTSDAQQLPAVCTQPDGDFVVTWTDSGAHDGNGAGIFVQRFAGNGTPQGSESLVNTYTTGPESLPAIACDGRGGFVVAWQSGYRFGFQTQDGNSAGVFAQRFDDSGVAVGTEFQVNTFTTGLQGHPDVCSDPTGNFVIAWESKPLRQDLPGNDGVFAQRYAPDGTPAASEFQVNTATIGSPGRPTICCQPSGNFVVAWEHAVDDSAYPLTAVTAQRFDSTGTALGTEFSVDASPQHTQSAARLACGGDGDFVVAWEDYSPANGYGIAAQHFAGDGTLLGSQWRVVADGAEVLEPSVAADASGDFIVAWREVGIDRSGSGIAARRYTRDGAALGATFQVNAYTTDNQSEPALAGLGAGRFVVVWTSRGEDGSAEGVFGQRFAEVVPSATGILAPCENGTQEWTFNATAEQPITVSVDTLDAASAADLCATLRCGNVEVRGDDERACTFAPPSFACPTITLIPADSGVCALLVSTCSGACRDSELARYTLSVDSGPQHLPLEFGGAPVTPGGPKPTPTLPPTLTPSPTTTPQSTTTPLPSDKRSLRVVIYKSVGGKAYVAVFPIGLLEQQRMLVTSVAISKAEVLAYAEPFDPPDTVLTAFAVSRPSNLLALDNMRRTDILPITADLNSLQFDRCAQHGDGVLTLPAATQATQVTFAGDGSTLPNAAPTLAVTAASESVPRAVTTTLERWVGSSIVQGDAIVFPDPQATCVGGPNDRQGCEDYAECPGGTCGEESLGPTCSSDPRYSCNPALPFCPRNGVCNAGGERVESTPRQNITLDDTVHSRIGNAASQPDNIDGFLLRGDCASSETCQAMVFIVDAADVPVVSAAAAGFLIDADNSVLGTVSGTGQPGSRDTEVACTPEEFRVDSQTLDQPSHPAVCTDAAGNFVAVWNGNSSGIFARRFSSTGSAIGSEFAVTVSADFAQYPDVACDAHGAFTVVWSQGFGINARHFDSSGVALGTEFRVSPSKYSAPKVAANAAGDLLVAWQDLENPGSPDVQQVILGRRLTSTGEAVGSPFTINVGGIAPLAVAGYGHENFIVAWERGSSGNSGVHTDIVAERLNSDGTALGLAFQVNGDTHLNQQQPAVAGDAAGNFVVAWLNDGETVVQRFTSSAEPTGPEFEVQSTGMTYGQYAPAVASDPRGNFVIVGRRAGVTGGIFARRYTSTGQALGPEFLLNTTLSGGFVADPDVACAATGSCVAVWQGVGIFGQRLQPQQ